MLKCNRGRCIVAFRPPLKESETTAKKVSSAKSHPPILKVKRLESPFPEIMETSAGSNPKTSSKAAGCPSGCTGGGVGGGGEVRGSIGENS